LLQLVPIGTRLAEMARMRLQYDEARKRIQMIQQQLADLEEKVTPGQAESDKDRLVKACVGTVCDVSVVYVINLAKDGDKGQALGNNALNLWLT